MSKNTLLHEDPTKVLQYEAKFLPVKNWLRYLNKASYQTLFNKTLLALRKQGRKSIQQTPLQGGNVICAYRGDNGNKCAFGHLIPDEVYHPAMDQGIGGVFSLMNNVDPNNILGKKKRDFFSTMQGAHDNYFYDRKEWEQKMAYISKEYSLKYSPPA